MPGNDTCPTWGGLPMVEDGPQNPEWPIRPVMALGHNEGRPIKRKGQGWNPGTFLILGVAVKQSPERSTSDLRAKPQASLLLLIGNSKLQCLLQKGAKRSASRDKVGQARGTRRGSFLMTTNSSTPFPLEFNLNKSASLIGIHSNTLRRWIQSGKVKASKGINGQYSIPLDEVERIRADHQAEGNQQG